LDNVLDEFWHLRLIYYEACLNEDDAKQREMYLKLGNRHSCRNHCPGMKAAPSQKDVLHQVP